MSRKGHPKGESGPERVGAKGAPVNAAPAVVVSPAGASPRFTALPPLSLYVHIPWCLQKCPYCDFNSHEARGAPD
jgi:coproporphyrinogen III oxidase-like Fe-S oxidoreductase